MTVPTTKAEHTRYTPGPLHHFKGGRGLNFLHLKYFLMVAEELNITRAAERLYISQQSLSNHISNMELSRLFGSTRPVQEMEHVISQTVMA